MKFTEEMFNASLARMQEVGMDKWFQERMAEIWVDATGREPVGRDFHKFMAYVFKLRDEAISGDCEDADS